MAKVVVLGAGFVSKPLVDYFLDRCKYEVVMASRTVAKAERIIAGRAGGRAVAWTAKEVDVLDEMVREADLVVCLIPRTEHITVARICLKHRTHMVTTDFITPEMQALDGEVRDLDLIFLNEIGEDPGLDHMGAVQMIDQVKSEGGRVASLTSFGAGLPAYEHNRNPFGYKFSWAPAGLLMSARMPAGYVKNGEKIEVPADELFDHHWLVDIEGIGTFEGYPNRDCERYLPYFGLDEKASLFRGLLRFIGYCNTMKCLVKLNLLDFSEQKDFAEKTYASFMASLVGVDPTADVAAAVAAHLDKEVKDDVIKKMGWLGLFDDRPVAVDRGANADLMVDLMVKKMSYGPGERDMIIVHDEIVAEFAGRTEKRVSSMMVEGIPNGDSAMSRAVALPTAVACRLMLENKVSERGVIMPVAAEIYRPVLAEVASFGLEFQHRTTVLDES